jgi:hypothetical protein
MFLFAMIVSLGHCRWDRHDNAAMKNVTPRMQRRLMPFLAAVVVDVSHALIIVYYAINNSPGCS